MTQPNTVNMAALQGQVMAIPPSLADAGPELSKAEAQIIAQLESLEQRLNTLRDTWIGSAATEYQAAQQEWNAGAQGLFGGGGSPGVLGEIAMNMKNVWQNYTECEWANTSTWTSGQST